MLNENKGNETETSSPIKTYAHVTMNPEISMNNQLRSIPTVLNDLGEEVVVYGYKDIVDNGNGKWLFKFSRDDGLNEVAAKSLRMVNGKPLLVYRWDPSIGLDKVEPSVLPVWVKLCNMLMEAWTNVGISAIASCLGKPKIMDSMTTYVCKSGMGRTKFARVLVEIEAIKGLKDEIELQYRDKNQVVKGTKKVKVEYDWKPLVCSHCNVFGHSFEKCSKRTRTVEEIARET
ncbi:RNA-directed DNA polymerase, eukaryota, reverse transcriptase zinc-binding domain protein [Tanacetum coccineum]|uniref:RNA-directed DNA polymerase, eukaryota, reverse transcriptase zinc-binding domain protein n=1 Tax=Tanacetum coccineum TaxID=301880 RepID=A0ABQ5CBF2_9ASTR